MYLLFSMAKLHKYSQKQKVCIAKKQKKHYLCARCFYKHPLMKKNNTQNTVEAPEQAAVTDMPQVEAAPKKKTTRSRKKVVAPVKEEEIKKEETRVVTETPVVEKTETKPIPRIAADLVIKDFCDLANSGNRVPLLKDDQIQQLTLEEAEERHITMEAILANVLDYDVVLSDTNIWLELLVGHTSSHSDPRVNARLQFERQLEFISKMMKRIGGRFTIMSETYEEIDRFASIQEPTNYKDADWTDEILCRNVAARLAKRLMLSQQKENRLRIVGICSECHHGAFADPAIIRHTVELFAQGKKVLLLTNDASVGIRSLGMCDDLQRVNNIDDKTWRSVYEPQRPMVLTMDDLKLLDNYTRQYHYLMMAAGSTWMQNVGQREAITHEHPLSLWLDGFRPGDKHERRSDRIEEMRREEQKARQKQNNNNNKKQEQPSNKQAQQKPAQQPTKNSTADTKQTGTEAKPVAPEVKPVLTEAKPISPETKSETADTKPAKSENNATVIEAQSNSAETNVATPTDAPISSFGATAEMMDLIAPQPGEKKSRTRRSSRRRNTSNKKQNNSQEPV